MLEVRPMKIQDFSRYNNIGLQVYKVFDKLHKKFGAAVIPLHNESKRCKYRYSSKIFQNDDFCEKDVSGIGLIVKRVKDLICIDIDCKYIDKDNVKKILLKHIDKNIYLEESPGGLHVFMKVKNREQFIFNVYKEYGSRFIANNVELFPDFDLRYVIIAPSIVKNAQYKSICGNIFSVDYVDYDFVFNLMSILKNIFGARGGNGFCEASNIVCEANNRVCEANTKVPGPKCPSISVSGDVMNECIYIDEYIRLLKSDEYKGLRTFLFKLEKIFKNNKKVFLDFLKNIDIDVVNENRLAYRIRSIIVSDGRYADAYIFKDTLIYYDFHFTKCALQLLSYLLVIRPKKFIKWLADEIPDFLINMLKYLKRFLSDDILAWLFKYIINSDSDNYNFAFKLRKVFDNADEYIKMKIKRWWAEGCFGRLRGLIEREFTNIFVNVDLLINKFRRFVCVKYALCGVISMTKNSAERMARRHNIDVNLFRRVLEGLGFKYYMRHKKFVRYIKIAKQHLELFLQLVEKGKVFENLWDDSKFDNEEIILVCLYMMDV